MPLRLLIALLLLFLPACVSGRSTIVTETPEPPADVLEGTEWVLAALNGRQPLPGTLISLNFDNGKAGGSAGCNQYGGSYRLEDGHLRIDMLAVTVMLCTDPMGVMEQEQKYVQTLTGLAIKNSAAFRLAGDTLEIGGLTFTRKLQFAVDAQELAGTAWSLAQVDGSAPIAVIPRLVFLNETEYAGFSGCRPFYGSYQAKGDDISFFLLNMLVIDCLGGNPAVTEEDRFLDGLSSATDARIDQDRLVLLKAGGKTMSFLSDHSGADIDRTAWRLMAFLEPAPQIGEGLRRPVELASGSTISLRLENGLITGAAGSDPYYVNYTIDGKSIEVDSIESSSGGCGTPGEGLEQEMNFFCRLETAHSLSSAGGWLLLETDGGIGLLFQRQEP